MNPTYRVLLSVIAASALIQTAPQAATAASCKLIFSGKSLLKPGPSISKSGKVGIQLADPRHPVGPLVNSVVKIFNIPLGTRRLTETVRRLENDHRDISFWSKLADAAQLKADISDGMLSKIPKDGPLIIPMNHPLYGWEAVAFLAKVSEVRPDVKVLMTDMLGVLPGLSDNAFLINVYKQENNSALRSQVVEHLRGGSALLFFPSGSISVKEKLSDPFSVDPVWKSGLMHFISEVDGVQIVPVAVDGEPGTAFQAAKKISDYAAMPLLLRGLAKNTKRSIRYFIGEPIPKEALLGLSKREALTYIRARLEAMRNLTSKKPARALEPIPAAGLYRTIENELFVSENSRTIYDSHPEDPSKGYLVISAYGRDLPTTMVEIGRQRNFAFRSVGEGSHKGIDTDSFDSHYVQLVLVDKAARNAALDQLKTNPNTKLDDQYPAIVGGYRLGKVDEILAQYGARGVYTTEFFDYEPLLQSSLNNSIELGRSFIHENHRGGRTLLVLWRGIMKEIILNAKEHGRFYTKLIGPVSMSGDYSENTKHLVSEIRRNERRSDLAQHVRPKTPVQFKTPLTRPQIDMLLKVLADDKARQRFIKDIEQNPDAELPPLFGLYDSLEAKDLGINLDAEFNSVDWLILVDLMNAPERQIKFYVGKEIYEEFAETFGRIAK